MSTKKRILFIANEMSPYVELTEFSEIINKLAIKSNDSGMEVINQTKQKDYENKRLTRGKK